MDCKDCILHEDFHVQKLIQTDCYTDAKLSMMLLYLCEFCIFAAHIYIPACVHVQRLVMIQRMTWMLFRRMREYAHNVVSQAALKKLQKHLWYLGSEMAPLSLFSSKASDDQKKSIVKTLILSGDDWSVRGNHMSSG